MLEIQDISKKFGGNIAVRNVSIDVARGEILGIIGPNGAGKTTLLNIISGVYRTDTGNIYLNDELISNLNDYEITRRGVGRTYQITRLFENMTLVENLLVPFAWTFTWSREREQDLRKKAVDTLEIFDIARLKDELAMHLSGGQQKLVELARVTMMDSDLMLLDEPFYGIHPTLKKRTIDYIKKSNETKDKTFIVISHDVGSIMGLCREVVVMVAGELIAKGKPEVIRNNDEVIKAYLGT